MVNENLAFDNFFKFKDCNKLGAVGKMQVFKNNNQLGLLLSTSEGGYNKPSKNIQNDNSIFGKILFIPFNGKEFSIFSKGHRVIQGLYSDKNIIIATEHGQGAEMKLIILFSLVIMAGRKYRLVKNIILIIRILNQFI